MTPAIELSDVRKSFGATPIISGLLASIVSITLYTTSSCTFACVKRMLSMV